MTIKKFKFDNTYTSLPNKFFSKITFTNQFNPEKVIINDTLAMELNIDSSYLSSSEGLNMLSGNETLGTSPYALAYAGHQFGHFTMLGDGRAAMLGEHLFENGNRVDVQLKGSGKTPYSRGGDGKATLRSALREHLISESMHRLNIPTSRSLAVVKTGELIRRTTLEEGAVLTRVAKSHIRFGTFEYAKVYGGDAMVKSLADYAIERHYPELESSEDKYTLFLNEVMLRQAQLISKWQSVGFIHGVMNTDNMLISGETIDYGPCAFMDTYDPKQVFSSIDQNGRYRYDNQPYIVSWNIARLAETILHLLDNNKEKAIEKANTVIKSFGAVYKIAWGEVMCKKIGITNPSVEDYKLIENVLSMIEHSKLDFTNTFRLMSLEQFDDIMFKDGDIFKQWKKQWEQRLLELKISLKDAVSLMKQHNPVMIPRNELLQKALNNASQDSYELYFGMLEYLKHPFDYSVKIPSNMLRPLNGTDDFISYCGT